MIGVLLGDFEEKQVRSAKTGCNLHILSNLRLTGHPVITTLHRLSLPEILFRRYSMIREIETAVKAKYKR
jgi:hypothetical protein